MNEQGVRFADRSDRGKIRLTGPQAAWYLHQVTAQAFEGITPGETRDAAMLTHNGRMIGFFEAIATEDAILCHFESELRDTLVQQLRSYVFATEVEIDDVTDEFGLVLVLGDASSSLGVDVVGHPTAWAGMPATYLWVAAAEKRALLDELRESGSVQVDETELERIRIAAGVPRWGREMDTKTFPQEAGIDAIAVHYDKGCYTGQEAMAKIHFRGKVNRKLVKLRASAPLVTGSDVLLDGTRIGSVTSAAPGPDGDFVALALVKHDVPDGAAVQVGSAPATVNPAA